MRHQTVQYVADGLQMVSDLYLPEAGGARRPGVLVFPEAFGIGEHVRARARRLAEQGYLAPACDLHGNAARYDRIEDVMGLIGPLRGEVARIRARAAGGLDALRARPEVDPARIAAIGFCFGGTMSLELARSGADIRAVTGFHSGLATVAPDDAKHLKARVLGCIGAADPAISAQERAAFEPERRAGAAGRARPG